MLTLPVRIDRSRLAAASGPVVKKEQFTSLLEARQIVDEATRYAATLKADTQEQVAASRAQGYEAGFAQAQMEFAASMTETAARMQAAFVGLELRIVNTVMHALQQILKQIDDRVLMERLVRQVLAQSRSQKDLRLRVSAQQFDMVNQWLSTVLQEHADVEFIDVLKDPAAAPGTCVLESEFGAIDASIDVQLAAIRRGLVNAFIEKRVVHAATRDATS